MGNPLWIPHLIPARPSLPPTAPCPRPPCPSLPLSTPEPCPWSHRPSSCSARMGSSRNARKSCTPCPCTRSMSSTPAPRASWPSSQVRPSVHPPNPRPRAPSSHLPVPMASPSLSVSFSPSVCGLPPPHSCLSPSLRWSDGGAPVPPLPLFFLSGAPPTPRPSCRVATPVWVSLPSVPGLPSLWVIVPPPALDPCLLSDTPHNRQVTRGRSSQKSESRSTPRWLSGGRRARRRSSLA